MNFIRLLAVCSFSLCSFLQPVEAKGDISGAWDRDGNPQKLISTLASLSRDLSHLRSVSVAQARPQARAWPQTQAQAYPNLAVVHMVPNPHPNPHPIKPVFRPALNQVMNELGRSTDDKGYHWQVQPTHDNDLHLSLAIFQNPRNVSYTDAHVAEIKKSIQKLVPYKNTLGQFYRVELWTHTKNPDGSKTQCHWVDQNDFTQNEARGIFSDLEVRPLNTFSTNFSFDSAHIVLRYGTRGVLIQGAKDFVDDLERRAQGSVVAKELFDSREVYANDLTGHLSVAKIFRCEGNDFKKTKVVTGNHVEDLKGSFFRMALFFRQNAPDQNPVNRNNRCLSYSVNSFQVTTGVGGRREVLGRI